MARGRVPKCCTLVRSGLDGAVRSPRTSDLTPFWSQFGGTIVIRCDEAKYSWSLTTRLGFSPDLKLAGLAKLKTARFRDSLGGDIGGLDPGNMAGGADAGDHSPANTFTAMLGRNRPAQLIVVDPDGSDRNSAYLRWGFSSDLASQARWSSHATSSVDIEFSRVSGSFRHLNSKSASSIFARRSLILAR